jgi:starch phosphorylase
MYRRGYFRQRIDASGWQQEFWVPTDPERTPAVLVTEGDERTPVRVTVPVGEHDVAAQIWRVDVGRVPLFLLDTELPENDRVSRWITQRLYDGDTDTRLAQYTVLGAAAPAALRALGIEPGVVHMNEGHPAFGALEAARAATTPAAATSARRFEAIRRPDGLHDPHAGARGQRHVPAEQVAGTLRRLVDGSGTDMEGFVRLGRTHPDDGGEPFGVTQLALRSSRAANGVSRRHGEVAREMWQGLWPDRGVDDVPITHVTNGVTCPRGSARRCGACSTATSARGGGWRRRSRRFAAIDDIPAEDLWAVRGEQRSCWSSSSASAACSSASRAATRATTRRLRPARSTPTR